MFTAVADASQVAEARRLAGDLARRIGLPPARIDQVAIVVTELATNMLKHGGGGHIHAGRFDDADGTGLELLALDQRRRHGRSGALHGRMATRPPAAPARASARSRAWPTRVRIYTRPGQGMAIMARFVERPAPQAPGPLLGAVLAPYPGEPVCGDNWSWSDTARRPHDHAGRRLGPRRRGGARRGRSRCGRSRDNADAAIARSSSSGCIARWRRPAAPRWRWRASTPRRAWSASSGSAISARMLVNAGKSRHMVSHNGTAGHVAPRIREFTYDFTGEPLVILHSDGLTSRWDLAAYPGLAAQHPSLVAGVLLRDHRRGRDDASVVAMRARHRRRHGHRLLRIAIAAETDIVLVRSRTRRLAELIGFDAQDQTRITTAVSEIARNAYEYARRRPHRVPPDRRAAGAELRHRRRATAGPASPTSPAVLAGSHKSATGMGIGLLGARRLMDAFDIDVEARRRARRCGSARRCRGHAARSRRRGSTRIIGCAGGGRSGRRRSTEISRQNQQILLQLEELRTRQEDLQRLNQELQDTNRGVVALYAELDERADHLRRADELKSKIPLAYEPRVPHAAELDPGAVAAAAGAQRRRADGGAGDAGPASSARRPRT